MLICPVCGQELTTAPKIWSCINRHSFDVARQGYVNLLPVNQKHSLHPGDTKEMVAARRNFLDQGFYRPIVELLKKLLLTYAPQATSILDVGCGEGYYLSQLETIPNRWGIDISKEAVRFAAVREKNAHWITATASHLPFSDGSFDALLSMFALTVPSEFHRVLKENGIYVQVLAGTNHLPELKKLIYPEIIEKEKNLCPELPGFSCIHSEPLTFTFTLNKAEQLHDLLYMTPHVWRISKDAAEAMQSRTELTDQAEVVFNIYSRQAI